MIKIPYGYDKHNLLFVHISKVPSGKSHLICPGCKDLLVAAKGEIMAHHFRHLTNDCNSAYESTVHLYMKEKICENKFIIINKNKYIFDKIFEEKAFGKYKLDIFGITNKKVPIILEIFVTHKLEKEKIEFIRKTAINCWEIYVPLDTTFDDIDRFLALGITEIIRTNNIYSDNFYRTEMSLNKYMQFYIKMWEKFGTPENKLIKYFKTTCNRCDDKFTAKLFLSKMLEGYFWDPKITYRNKEGDTMLACKYCRGKY